MAHRLRGHLANPVPPSPARWLLTLALISLPGAVAGQLVEGPIVPSGQLRLDIDSHFVTWNERFGLRGEPGSLVEEIEPLGWNLTTDALGSDRLPGAALGEARLRTLLENPDYRYNLGSTTHLLAAHVRRVPLGFRLGVLPWVTVGASWPMVQRKLDSELIFSPGDASAGLAPSQSASIPFLTEYRDAFGATRIAVDGRCAVGANSAECLQGQAVVQSAGALLEALSALYGETLYMPLQDSEAGQALIARMADVRAGMAEIEPNAFTAELPLGIPLDRAGFDSLLVIPAFGEGGLPRRGLESLWEPGDLEVSMAVQLLNTVPRPPDPSDAGAADSLDLPADDAGGGLGVQLGVAGTMRLGTGTPQDTLRDFLDMELMEGQMDIEVHGFGSLSWARRVGVAFDVRYGIASPVSVRRRVAPPDAGFVEAPPLVAVQWQPGNYINYAVSPHVLLTPHLSLGFLYRSYSRQPDTYGSGAPELAPLALETEATVQSMGIDVRYSSFAAGGFPMEVRFGWESARNGTGGRTPKTGIVRFGASLFSRIWGGS